VIRLRQLPQKPQFSPDGNYLYFIKATDATNTNFDLFRAPVLGALLKQ